MIHRRDLLRAGVGGTLTLASGVTFWPRDGRHDATPVFVLVQLTGGNDGLNTVVPYADDRYFRARPLLAIPAASVHRLNDSVGLAPSLPLLAKEFVEGRLTVVHGVGMPRPDRSHFESLARWHSGSLDPRPGHPGWLARALGTSAPSTFGSQDLPSLALGSRVLPDALRGGPPPALACADLDSIAIDAATREALLDRDLRDLDARWGSPDDRSMARSAHQLLERLNDVLRDAGRGVGRFPESPLGRQLRDVARLLHHGLRPRAIFVQTGGFDTHARQSAVHPALLAGMDAALAAFFSRVRAERQACSVLVLVHSEFGRRVRENGTGGTDHGVAAPVFFWGGRSPGGCIGTTPDLADLDDGDVRSTLDFRRVLSTARNHLDPDSAATTSDFPALF